MAFGPTFRETNSGELLVLTRIKTIMVWEITHKQATKARFF